MAQYIRFFREIGAGDVALVGGKNASLGEMVQNLASAGVNIPNGFAITADAYRYVLEASGAGAQLREALAGLHPDRTDELRRGRAPDHL
jgi:pyruvate, water dikinase